MGEGEEADECIGKGEASQTKPSDTEDLDSAIVGPMRNQSPPVLVDHQLIWSEEFRLGVNVLILC